MWSLSSLLLEILLVVHWLAAGLRSAEIMPTQQRVQSDLRLGLLGRGKPRKFPGQQLWRLFSDLPEGTPVAQLS